MVFTVSAGGTKEVRGGGKQARATLGFDRSPRLLPTNRSLLLYLASSPLVWLVSVNSSLVHYSLPAVSSDAVVYTSFPPGAHPKQRTIFPSTSVVFENAMSKDGERQVVRETEVRRSEERRLERSDSSISPTTITNNLPFVALLLTAARSSQPCFAIGSGNGIISVYRGGSCVQKFEGADEVVDILGTSEYTLFLAPPFCYVHAPPSQSSTSSLHLLLEELNLTLVDMEKRVASGLKGWDRLDLRMVQGYIERGVGEMEVDQLFANLNLQSLARTSKTLTSTLTELTTVLQSWFDLLESNTQGSEGDEVLEGLTDLMEGVESFGRRFDDVVKYLVGVINGKGTVDVVLQRLIAYDPKLFEIPSSEAMSFQGLIQTVEDAVHKIINKV